MGTKQRLPDGRRRGRWAWAQHLRGGQECAGPLEQVTISGTEQTVVAHFDEVLGQRFRRQIRGLESRWWRDLTTP